MTSKREGEILLGLEIKLHRLSLIAMERTDRLRVRYVDHVELDCFRHCQDDDNNKSTEVLFSVEILLRAIDLLLDRCYQTNRFQPSQVRCISCVGDPCFLVLLRHSACQQLNTLSASLNLYTQLANAHFFSAPYMPTCQDFTGVDELAYIQTCLDYHHQDATWARLGSFGLQLAKVKTGSACGGGSPANAQVQDGSLWSKTGYILTPARFLASVFAGHIQRPSLEDATATGLSASSPSSKWKYDCLSILSRGSPNELAEKLGNPQTAETFQTNPDRVSSWLVRRYQFDARCLVAPAMPASLAAFASFLPTDKDVGLGADRYSDQLFIPFGLNQAANGEFSFRQSQLFNVNVASEVFQGAAKVRRQIRDAASNGRWSVFSTLVQAVPPGGTVGLDDKLYLLGPQHQSQQLVVHRFEHGDFVQQFSDLRADPRCLLESQVFAFRERIERLHGEGWTPSRIFVWGSVARNPRLTEILSLVIGGVVVVDSADVEASEEESKQDDRLTLNNSSSTACQPTDTRKRSAKTLNDGMDAWPWSRNDPTERSMYGAVYHGLAFLERVTTGSKARFNQMVLDASSRKVEDDRACSLVNILGLEKDGSLLPPKQRYATATARYEIWGLPGLICHSESQSTRQNEENVKRQDKDKDGGMISAQYYLPRWLSSALTSREGEDEVEAEATGDPIALERWQKGQRQQPAGWQLSDEQTMELSRVAFPDIHLYQVYSAYFAEFRRLSWIVEHTMIRQASRLPNHASML